MNKDINHKFKYTIVILIIILLNIINIYILYLPKIDYYIYSINSDQYTILDAIVVDKKEKIIIYGKPRPLVDINETCITFEMDDEVKYEKICTYPKMEVSEQILIAVKGSKIRRCIPYKFSSSDTMELLLYVFMTVIFLIIDIFLYKLHRMNEKIVEQENLYRISESEYDNYSEIENKKRRIVELMNVCNLFSTEAIVEKEYIENRLDCCVNDQFVWCLEKFIDMEDEGLLFPLGSKDEKISYIDATKKLRTQGLPSNYYVVAICEGDYMCGCANEDMVFVYNRGLGLLHTNYFTIFDYIIEKLETSLKVV